MNIVLSLYRLQVLDTQIQQMNRRINDIENILAEDSVVQKAKLELDLSNLNEKKLQGELKNQIHVVEDKKLKWQLNQAQLFGGKIRNPKELQDLQSESDALKRAIAKLEDEQLEKMILVEEAQAEIKQAEHKLNQAVGDQSSRNAQLLGEKTKIESELPGLLAQKESIIPTLPNDVFVLYTSLLKTKAGVAVANVRDDSCDACGSTLTPAELQSVRSPTSTVRCSSCGRILFKS